MPDYPTRDELPTLLYEVRDEVARQVRCHEAVYKGLAGEDAEVHQAAREAKLRELRRWVLATVRKRRALPPSPTIGPWPEHTCQYWRTREGVCSMCGTRLVRR